MEGQRNARRRRLRARRAPADRRHSGATNRACDRRLEVVGGANTIRSEADTSKALGCPHCSRRLRKVVKRADLGLDRRPCDRCGHRGDMHVIEADGLRTCVVCSQVSQRFPCSRNSLTVGPSSEGAKGNLPFLLVESSKCRDDI